MQTSNGPYVRSSVQLVYALLCLWSNLNVHWHVGRLLADLKILSTERISCQNMQTTFMYPVFHMLVFFTISWSTIK